LPLQSKIFGEHSALLVQSLPAQFLFYQTLLIGLRDFTFDPFYLFLNNENQINDIFDRISIVPI